MWRWIHSLPRAIRQKCHNHCSGASAGISVEEQHETGCKKEVNEAQSTHFQWKWHCKPGTESNTHKEEESSRPTHDFWNLVYGPRTTCEALGLGGVLGAVVHLHRAHFEYLRKKYGSPDTSNKCCPINHLPVLHALPGDRRYLHTSSQSSVADAKSTVEKTPTKPSIVKSLWIFDPHTRSSFFQTAAKKSKKKSKIDESKADASVKNKSCKQDTQATREDLGSVFADFSAVCDKYTATGKGIQGAEAAENGDWQQAAQLWRESSDLGNTKAKFNLAICYEHGKGVAENKAEAVRLYRQAAEDLHPEALYNLGLLYMEGSPLTPCDHAQGLQMITTAADLGLSKAQRYLGVFYTQEDTEDQKKAVKYLTLGANQHDVECEYALGLCYQHGAGVRKDMQRAYQLLSQAAEHAHPEATYSLAMFHQHGLIVPQDMVAAEKLTQKAASLGCIEARNALVSSRRTQEHQQKIAHIKIGQTEKGNVPKEEKSHKTLGSCMSSPSLTDLPNEHVPQNSAKGSADNTGKHILKNGFHQSISEWLSVLPLGFSLSYERFNSTKQGAENGQTGSLRNIYDDGVEAESNHAKENQDLNCSLLHRRTNTMPNLSIVQCP
ncbi:uncharacterized protein LOC127877320 [Dreissena polymorpha]|uniref:Death ligand signal enhancer n=1 Tax=Dreissena polymorpha TaxID=45954 RepID=A0A9D4K8F3_DREPO|nr:uncharacterized protein LOC127877320 [Dreissena polymorpha]KAH3835042.1 hypothetical protein DPMN_108380 [Dreissena polymorpha]